MTQRSFSPDRALAEVEAARNTPETRVDLDDLDVSDLIDLDDIPTVDLDGNPVLTPESPSPMRGSIERFKAMPRSRPAPAPDFVQVRPGAQMTVSSQVAFFWIDSRCEIQDELDSKLKIANPTYGWFLCRSPYKKEMVDELKLVIPYEHDGVRPQRLFLKSLKVWAVRPRFSETLVNITSKYFQVRELQQDPWARASESNERTREVVQKLRENREDLLEARNAESVELPEFQRRKVEV